MNNENEFNQNEGSFIQQEEQENMNNQFQNPDYVQVTEGYNPNYNNYNNPKKSKVPFIILGVVVSIIVVIAMLVVSALRPKESITAEEFKTIMQEKGYLIQDTTSQYAEYDYLEKLYIAYDKEDDFQIEFFEFKDKKNAEDFFLINSNIFNQDKEIASYSFSVKGPNYCTYTLGTVGAHRGVYTINNTGIYIDVDSEDADEVKDILKELKYN